MSDHEPDNQPDNQPQHELDQPDRSPDADAVHIPAPRAPLDDQPDIPIPSPPDEWPGQSQHHDGAASEDGWVEPEFRYEQTWNRGKRRRYHGFVERVGGVEGERLREDLAAAVRDLLDWAAQHDGANGPDAHSTESVDGADSGDSKDSDEGQSS